MKKVALILLIFLTLALTFIIIYRNKLESEKAPPVAGIFNHYIAQLAEANKKCIAFESRLHGIQGKSVEEKNALLDQYIQQLETARGKVERIQAPEELADLKPLYLNMYDYLVESTQYQKKQLQPDKTTNPDYGEEEDLVSSKGLTAYGQLESFINSLQVGYEVKCLNKKATINLEKIAGDKYFIDK